MQSINRHPMDELESLDAFEHFFEDELFDDSIDQADIYRRGNQRFRKNVLAEICRASNHPLRFLIVQRGSNCVWRSVRDRRIDAGHVTPVAILRQRGSTNERLAVQDRRLNRSMQATPIQVRNIRGIPVEANTARQWIRARLLSPRQWRQAIPSRGRRAFDEADDFFALGTSHDWMTHFD
jgi:hypothetical protein